MRPLYWLIFLILFVIPSLYAHEHKKTSHADTTHSHVDELMDSTKHPVDTSIKGEEKPSDYKVILPRDMIEHLHNKIVHFPIAFVVAGFLFTLLNFRWKVFDRSIQVLVIIAGLASLAAFFTGNNQAGAFEFAGKEWLVDVHKNFGIATIVTIWLWILFLYLKPLQKYAWMISFIAMILVLITGFYGGIIAH